MNKISPGDLGDTAGYGRTDGRTDGRTTLISRSPFQWNPWGIITVPNDRIHEKAIIIIKWMRI